MASLEVIQGSIPGSTSSVSPPPPSFMLSFIAGTAGGIAQTLVAQPVSCTFHTHQKFP